METEELFRKEFCKLSQDQRDQYSITLIMAPFWTLLAKYNGKIPSFMRDDYQKSFSPSIQKSMGLIYDQLETAYIKVQAQDLNGQHLPDWMTTKIQESAVTSMKENKQKKFLPLMIGIVVILALLICWEVVTFI